VREPAVGEKFSVASASPQSAVEGQDFLHRCDDVVGGGHERTVASAATGQLAP
jgi:hypothetical protein